MARITGGAGGPPPAPVLEQARCESVADDQGLDQATGQRGPHDLGATDVVGDGDDLVDAAQHGVVDCDEPVRQGRVDRPAVGPHDDPGHLAHDPGSRRGTPCCRVQGVVDGRLAVLPRAHRDQRMGGAGDRLANSLTASVLSTVLVIGLALPAAYALSIRPVGKWTDVMFFFLSTKMLPIVAGILPLYLIA